MKKVVNGKVVDVKNMELFELAAEGTAIQATATSKTSDGIIGELKSDLMQKYIKLYDIFFRAMPYPLYAIESDIKYATLGNFIKAASQDNSTMWVDNGLHIRVDDSTGLTLQIVNGTWSINYCTDAKVDNTSMDLFRKSTGYNEYCWLLKKVIGKEATANFYMEFMEDFVKACNGQSMILKWELENILAFGVVPSKQSFKQGAILDRLGNIEYSLDIYSTGYTETGDKTQTWSLIGSNIEMQHNYKRIKTYDYILYCKTIQESDKVITKIDKSRAKGIQNVFMELCGEKTATESIQFPDFYGAIYNNSIAFTVNGKLFVCKLSRLEKTKYIAQGVELYSIDNGKVYFIKSKQVSKSIKKETLYSYSFDDDITRMCKISFRY